MAAHTPGPWRTEIGDRNLYHIHERRLILAAREGDPDGVITIAKMPEGFSDNSEADARLIASAPDLLEALKIANAAINPSDIGGISLLERNHRLGAATVAICAAIAKAEGRVGRFGTQPLEAVLSENVHLKNEIAHFEDLLDRARGGE